MYFTIKQEKTGLLSTDSVVRVTDFYDTVSCVLVLYRKYVFNWFIVENEMLFNVCRSVHHLKAKLLIES